MIISIDPGPEESAYVFYEDGKPIRAAKRPNGDVLRLLKSLSTDERNVVATVGALVHRAKKPWSFDSS